MKIDRWRRIEDIVDTALELDAGERAAYLDAACEDDAELRREIESLLAGELEVADFIETPAFAFAAELLVDAHTTIEGKQFGHYRVVREIGRGGMGAVYLAERFDNEFQQQVALKIVRRHFADAELARRFRRERQILASLNHENIARLLDGGVSDEGEPFFAMEYVEGARIDDYCRGQNFSVNQRLQLLLQVCGAIAYAHQRLVIHRDIKPSNIIVTPDGTPKLLDFGIAKLLDAEQAGEHTQTNFRVFTPDYAAPEQIAGGQITTATDVYSLGVLLNSLLFDDSPHPTHTSPSSKPHRWMSRSVSEPSAVASGLLLMLKRPPASAERSDRSRVNSELRNISLMARRDEPARRYASVQQFAEDVQRYLDGLPVRAQRDSFAYRAEKFVRRNRVGLAATALVALSLVSGTGVALWQAGIARAERDRAERRFADVRQLSNALLSDIAPKIERLQGSTEARQALVIQSLKYLDSLAREAGDDVQLQSELAAAYEKIGELQGAPRKPNLSDFTGALASYEKARAILRDLLEKNANDSNCRSRLAANLAASASIRSWAGDISGSLADSAAALHIYDELLREEPAPQNLRLARAEAQIDFANTHYFNDRLAEVYPPLRDALSTLETLERANPNDTEIQRLLGRGYTNLGMTLSWDDKQTEGEALMTKATAIGESLVERDPQDNMLRAGLLHTYLQSSQLYQESDANRSLAILLKALRVAEESIKADATDTQARQNLAKTRSMLGVISVRLKQLDEAVSYLEQSATTFAELERNEPLNKTYRHDTGRVFTHLGLAEFERRNFPEALAWYAKAAELFEADARADAKNISPRRKLAGVHTYIADTHRAAAKLNGERGQAHRAAARENYRRALDFFLRLEADGALAGFDRKYLEEVRVAVKEYESN